MTMTKVSKIEIPVQPETARALSHPRNLEAVGHLEDRLVRPDADDPLIALLKRTSTAAKAAGLTQDNINAELAAHKAERRGRASTS
jgi:hypothetical protein